MYLCVFVCVISWSVMSNSLKPHGLQHTRFLCPQDFSGMNTEVGSQSLLQGIFPTQGSNQGLLHCRKILYHLSHQGTDCGSDNEVLIAKFRHKMKKVGKTNRSFRYDLNQIPYDYTVEVANRFKGLDLIEHLKKYGRRLLTLFRRQ